MSAGWESDKRWSDRFLPQIKRELGSFLLSEPPVEEDQSHNTDLIVLKMDSVRIACRVRKFTYFENQRYRNEFTVRAGRPNGNRTELSKIIEGWGDFLFYGFSDKKESELVAWRVLSLNAFRLWFNRMLVKNKGTLPGSEMGNHDGSSCFRAFNATEIPDCVCAESGFEQPQEELVYDW